MMQFESLANELLLDLFEYFDGVYLFRIFDGLNSRFDALLYKHFRAFHLDLRRVSKQDFDFLCQQHLSLIVDRIVSLRLADHDETPGLPELFLSHGFTIDQFIHLQSLSLYQMNSISTIKILGGLHRIVHLTHLTCIRCGTFFLEQDIVDYISNLPKLTHFHLEIDYWLPITGPMMISSTLEYLCIRTFQSSDFKYMVNLCQYRPRLRVLSMYIHSFEEKGNSPIVVTSIMTLNLKFWGHSRALNNIFQYTPNLRHLTIEVEDRYLNGYSNGYLNGHEWKQIIVDHLPKLKVLRFKMASHPFRMCNTEEQVDELLDTFRTPFWLDEHQWYVRFDWNTVHSRNSSCLYTLPYAFDVLTHIATGRSKWTCPDDKKYWSFDRVQKLHCSILEREHLCLDPVTFPNIHELKMALPLRNKIWRIIPIFDHLTTLCMSIMSDKKKSESDLQALLDRAIHLYRLEIVNPYYSHLLILCRLTSVSIRQLKFIFKKYFVSYCLHDAECTALAKSPLGRQCEVLNIRVQFQTSIVNLVNTMTNLRAMTIYFAYDYNYNKSSQTKAELIKWFEDHLTRRFSISNDNYRDIHTMQLWIG